MSWEQLLGFHQINRSEALQFEQEPPAACPIDGTPLDIHPSGARNCPLGNYIWHGGPKLQ